MMAKTLVASSLLLSLFILTTLVHATPPTVKGHGSVGGRVNCGVACAARCSLSSRPNLCNRACGTCCARCQCVPPGTSGNHDVCPCYATMTTHGGHLKCP